MNIEKLPIIKIISYAQNAEDVILYRAFKDRTPGFYVDLGAGHPIVGSLTKNLFEKLSWKGLEVEANIELTELLKVERLGNVVLNVGVSDKDGMELFLNIKDNWAMSHLTSEISKDTDSQNTTKVKTLSLNTILSDNNVLQNFELLKVDIEGSEMNVLQKFDFDYWKPKVIVVETVTPNTLEKRNDLINYIISKYYKHCLFDGINSFFARVEETEIIEKISIPANVHDKYIPLVFWKMFPNETKEKYPELKS